MPHETRFRPSPAVTFALWVVGHFNDDLRNFQGVLDSPAAVWTMRTLYYVLPNFSAFDIKAQVVYGRPIAALDLGVTVAYGAVYIALVLTAAVTIFERRDLK